MRVYEYIVLGVIKSVDSTHNSCVVSFKDHPDEKNVSLNFPFVSIYSGIRFMPNIGDIVLVGFRPGAIPEIIGFKMLPEDNQILQQADTDQKLHYRTLQPGEIVLYSGDGLNEIYLSNSGVQIGSGISVIRLDEMRRSMEFMSSMIKASTLNGMNLKTGYVERPNPLMTGVLAETAMISDPSLIEFNLSLNKVTGQVVGLQMGDVVDPVGNIEYGTSGNKNFSLKLFNQGVQIGEVYTDLDSVALNLNHVFIGNMAVYSAVLGEELNSQLASLVSSLKVLMNDLNNTITLGKAPGGITFLVGYITQLCGIVAGMSGGSEAALLIPLIEAWLLNFTATLQTDLAELDTWVAGLETILSGSVKIGNAKENSLNTMTG